MSLAQKTENKVKTYVGFSIRAGKAVFGVDRIAAARKRLYLILADENLAHNSEKRLDSISKARGIALLRLSDLPAICAVRNCKALAVADEELAKAIEREFHRTGEL